MKIFIYTILLIVFTGCGTPKFYKEIDVMQKQVQKELKSKKYGSQIKIKSYNMNKLVLEELKFKLKETNHIIYYSVPDNSLFSKKYWFVVYDVENKKYYYLQNSSHEPKKINIIEDVDMQKDQNVSFVFDNYLNNRCDVLKNKGNKSLSGIRSYEVIYEVDLKSNESKKCYFKNFIIFD